MCVALIGGMDRLERHYVAEAERLGVELKVFTKFKANIPLKIKNVDALVIFTNKVSHKAKGEVMSIAKAGDIPVLMHHSCGISTLRDCLHCLVNRSVIGSKERTEELVRKEQIGKKGEGL
ncbi:MAG TPA: DUF2325 domain-containing protein [Proteobacteria bacterium]|nr:DUF2325 domain-containing protein [Pseudomonadota bacterium]